MCFKVQNVAIEIAGALYHENQSNCKQKCLFLRFSQRLQAAKMFALFNYRFLMLPESIQSRVALCSIDADIMKGFSENHADYY
ncbi:hypothetical protein C9928_01670 [Pseudidiomarina aestuarii]|uniref:Uncharacterized protein n=1 Tax=Pseudidiomarina aestuarii TaxID=624146 RepID=A0A6N4DCN8_9GAMM|nr:hypothetical protein C9928_01670 [Pseudidiomarina aestuarii]